MALLPAVCRRPPTQPQVGFGEQFKIVGNQKQLGNWDATKALELTWNEGDVWAATAELPVGVDIEFKVGVLGPMLQSVTRRPPGQPALPQVGPPHDGVCVWTTPSPS